MEGRDVMLQTARGEVFGGKGRDVTDFEMVKCVIGERRDFADCKVERGRWGET